MSLLTLTHPNHTNSSKCLQPGFFISLLLGRRGRENQQLLKKHMLVSRETPSGEKYLEMSRERGAVLATKNHQGGLHDKEDESNGKTFERPGSKRCSVKLIEKYLSHLNPECSRLFQKPRSPCKSFNPAKDAVWYCSTPLGHNTIEYAALHDNKSWYSPTPDKPPNQSHHCNGSIYCQHRKSTHHSNNRASKRSQHPVLLWNSNIRVVQNNVKQAWRVLRSGRKRK